MPQKSGFFDTTADDPREYPAREFAEYFGRLLTNGVFNGGTNLQVTATGTDANVRISVGAAWIKGYAYSVFDAPLVLPIQPATTQDRIDRVVLRLDTSTAVRAIRALVVQGVASANPTAPVLIRSGDLYDLSLAQIRVKANSTIVLSANVTDERFNDSVCGLVNSLIRVDTATFQQQWDAFIASVQNQGFATPSFVDNRVSVGDYGTTTNVGNAYSVTTVSGKPTALSGFVRVTIKINVANTGASTLNVNGLGAKEIKKGNGNPIYSGNLKANSIYTLVYDGVSSFILQGEGGDYGTAIASEVLAGRTIGTETGIVTGTMPDRAGNNIQSLFTGSVAIPNGRYLGTEQVLPPMMGAGDLEIYNLGYGYGETGRTTFHRILSVRVRVAGTYRIKYNLSSASISITSHSRVYVSGVATSSVFSTNNDGSTVNVVYDVPSVSANSTIEVWVSSNYSESNYPRVGECVLCGNFSLFSKT